MNDFPATYSNSLPEPKDGESIADMLKRLGFTEPEGGSSADSFSDEVRFKGD